jgi:hypothetical protein
MYGTILQASGGSPQWWLVGWVASVLFLIIGGVITMAYYDDALGETPPDPELNQTEGDSA